MVQTTSIPADGQDKQASAGFMHKEQAGNSVSCRANDQTSIINALNCSTVLKVLIVSFIELSVAALWLKPLIIMHNKESQAII